MLQEEDKTTRWSATDKRKVVNRPSLETILNDVKETSFIATGKKYGVSDNTIRKWIKYYNKK